MPHIATVLALILSAFLLGSGCGKSEDETPVACLEGPAAYLEALREAPGEVRLDGEVPISECLAEAQSGGELAEVGGALVEAATRLNRKARVRPGGPANLQLGYLVGAVRRGSGETGGIHADLLRRVVAAARYAPGDRPLPPAFVRAYRQGFAAGLARG